ncbi:serine/threonine protein phosphatase [Staphylococcus phage Twort]|uniref:ORF049 n=2 Tax=Staphylococcus phage Twort (strain DSM 17442 / HER 48) TaxID=2908167 RepID=Q4Z929_BPTWO|nr:NinI-like serine-threonine phosphatase [Staphylococcus phage Twort]AAX92344.1 ORF049 [Staphylococcus phage Twort]QIW89038.1 serine/threonine protein phosphatase [Staphylococcus phage Twort]
MSIFVIPDIHGEYDKLMRLMNKIIEERKPEDTIVFLGDYIDRGDRSKDVVNYLFDLLLNDENVVALLGNHDDELYRIIENIDRLGIYDIEWLSRYCMETLDSYGVDIATLTCNIVEDVLRNDYDFIKNELNKLKESEDYRKFKVFMTNCRRYYKKDKYIFTHSGGVSWKPVEGQTVDQLMWSRDFQPRKDGFIHVCGHTPTSSGQVEKHNDMLLCDVGAVFRDIELPFIKLEELE